MKSAGYTVEIRVSVAVADQAAMDALREYFHQSPMPKIREQAVGEPPVASFTTTVAV